MDIKDILLFLRPGAPCAVQTGLAMRLASEYGAEVTGLCLFSEPAPRPADTYAIGSTAVADVLADRDQAVRELIEPIETAFRQAAAAHDCCVDWGISGPDEPVQLSALRARFADLAIMRRPAPQDHAGRDLVATLARTSGTPCLVVPDKASGGKTFDRIVLAWNGSREAKCALDDSLGFIERASSVKALIIDSDTTSRADGRWATALLEHLARHGVNAELHRVGRSGEDIGDAILHNCEALGADLLVMGAYGHPWGTESILGGATRTVLSRATIPVLMSH
jgi:nucleotide-binding universal stress UspA family protein